MSTVITAQTLNW